MQDFTILMPNPMPQSVVDGLSSHRLIKLWEHENREAVLQAEAGVVKGIAVGGHLQVDATYMSRFPALELVANLGVGYDSIDAVWAGQHGITVTNTPDVLNDEVADTALGLIIATVRQLPAAERYVRAGKWRDAPFPLTPTLRGRTVGIFGLGRIGKAIATRAESFGLNVVYHGRSPQAGVPYLYFPTLVGLAQACDILVVIAPGGPATRGVVNAEVLKALGPDGVLINVARGTVVDEKALIQALENGTILAAGLDVFEDEPHVPEALLAMDHVVLLPHVGSASIHTRAAMAQLVVDNLRSWAEGRGPVTPVAETPWPHRTS